MILTGGVSAGGLIIGFLMGCAFCLFVGFLLMSCMKEETKDNGDGTIEHTNYLA